MLDIGISIDWDYFCTRCPNALYTYEYTHTLWYSVYLETGDYGQVVGPSLPNLLEIIQEAFDFDIHDVPVLACENHALAYRWFWDVDMVINYDYHSDMTPHHPFGDQYFDAGTWAYALHEDFGVDILETYGKPLKFPQAHESWNVKGLLICRSSPWVHPRHDQEFLDVVESLDALIEGTVGTPRRRDDPPPKETPTQQLRRSVLDRRDTHTLITLNTGEQYALVSPRVGSPV